MNWNSRLICDTFENFILLCQPSNTLYDKHKIQLKSDILLTGSKRWQFFNLKITKQGIFKCYIFFLGHFFNDRIFHKDIINIGCTESGRSQIQMLVTPTSSKECFIISPFSLIFQALHHNIPDKYFVWGDPKERSGVWSVWNKKKKGRKLIKLEALSS